MTVQEDFDALGDFDFNGADVHLWIFKRSNTEAKYRASYVRTDTALEDRLKTFAINQQRRITEWAPYSHLAQPNECGCLGMGVGDTNFSDLKALVDEPAVDHAVREVKELRGVIGYLVRFSKDGRTVYAVRRSPTSWKAVYKKKGVINVVFNQGQLSAVAQDEFSLEPDFDFLALNETVFVAHKGGFESVMKYRAGYVQAFGDLQAQPEFTALFTAMQPLIDFVGSNAMHLRRMAVIQEKSLYANPGFLPALKEVSERHDWGIAFDVNGRIIPSAATASLILKVLLDQRLLSEVTKIMYDVPDAIRVA